MKKFDVIVIGSGIGGLVSAGLLASSGLKVLVLEKHSSPGGYLSSFRRKGFTFDSAVDCIAGIGGNNLISLVLKRLGVEDEIEFVRVNPIRTSIFPDMRIEVDADITAYMENLKCLFPEEKAGIENLFGKISNIYSSIEERLDSLITNNTCSFSSNNVPYKYAMMSYAELTGEFIKDHRLRAALSDRCPFTGLPPSKISAFTLTALIMSYFRMGAYRPVGGHQRLSDILAEGIRKRGGEILFNTAAEKIVVKDDSCISVRSGNNEEYPCRYVISNADFSRTFRDMIGEGHASFADEKLRHKEISSSFFIVYAGIRGGLGSQVKSSSIGYFPSYDMEGFFEPESAFSDKSSLGITIPTLDDKSLAPDGCHSVIFHEMVNFNFTDSWQEKKDEFTEKVLIKAERLVPDLRKKIVHIEAATPLTLARYTSNLRGAAYGWSQTPGHSTPFRHGIRNLFMAGHWGEMGGGVLAAAYSGLKAAAEICRKEGMKI